jgi:hypothetical protein
MDGIGWPTFRPLPCGAAATTISATLSSANVDSFLTIRTIGFIIQPPLITLNEKGRFKLEILEAGQGAYHRPPSRFEIKKLSTHLTPSNYFNEYLIARYSN